MSELTERPNPPWRAEAARAAPDAEPTLATAGARTVFGLAGELKNLVREDRMHRSQQARRLQWAGKSR